MGNRTVSIIMPCYNASQYIGDAIESVIAQSYSDWELLIVNDCSTDGSGDVISKYVKKDPRILLFSTEKSSGCPAGPRNIGMQNAKGRYIAFLDSDDLWSPEKLDKQIPLFNEKIVGVVFSWYEKINEKGERNGRIIRSPSAVSYKELLKGDCIGNLTAIYDTEKVGKVFQHTVGHEDYVMWIEILRMGYIAKNSGEVLAFYREQNISRSGNKLKEAIRQWQIYRKILNFSIFASSWFFCNYAVRALKKFLK